MLEPDRNLPNEILVHFFSRLSQHDLTKVALVSHRFNAIAERILYSSIDIDEKTIWRDDVPKRTLGWCDAMKRNQLYDVPRKLSIRWVMFGRFKTLSHSCSLVNDNIRRLTLLDTLELSIGPCDSTPTMVDLIRDLRLQNLQHCLLNAGDPAWPGSFDYTPTSGNMCGFIASHSGLRYLAGSAFSEPALAIDLAHHDYVPELSIFDGTPSGAAFILPGRPVYHLLLTGGQCDLILNSENLSRMALTSVPLRILDLSAMYMSPSVLRDIATHIPTIEILKVITTTLIVSHPYLHLWWINHDLFYISSYFASFKKLNWFDLASSGKKIEVEMDVQRSLCCSWHGFCPSLRHIFFPFVNYDDSESTMWEWYDDRGWLLSERPTEESADGLYRYIPQDF
ncbi:hypothetical protein F5887DRAFT_1135079 [Amanita rubescens]|nr:hypothetical protein F5887DRAFT_1135079 [Amanita rubescens]